MSNKTETLQQIKNVLEEFMKFTKSLNLSAEDFDKLLSPLTKSIAHAKFLRRIRYAVFLVLFGTLLYCLSYSQTVNDHATAITRIILIKILPFWDWRKLKNEKCLIKFSEPSQDTVDEKFNCGLCEVIKKIDTYYPNEITTKALFDHYINLHMPVIINQGISNWPLYETPNLTLILKNPKIADSYPCNLNSNIHNSPVSVDAIISKIGEFNECFVHFQNCETGSTKAFRSFTPRPSFLPSQLSPTRRSWLVVGKNYEFAEPKQLFLTESNAVVGLVKGLFIFKLVPRLNCNEECLPVTVELAPGEAMIITSLWDLYYEPDFIGENIAVVLEYR